MTTSNWLSQPVREAEKVFAKELFRPKESIDLTKVIPIDAELQHVVLKKWTRPGGDVEFSIQSHKHRVPKLLNISKSLRYASHSTDLGIIGPALLQLSLAICLELYGVSPSIKLHREFAGKYLMTLPGGEICGDQFEASSFHKSLYVPVAL